jgi:outer membrane protein assembly factor BamB
MYPDNIAIIARYFSSKFLNTRIMKIKFAFILSAIPLCIAYNAQAQTAIFGKDPQHTGVYYSSFPANMMLTKKWSFKTNGKIFSSAVVADDVIYFGSDDSCLYALDTVGMPKWKFKSNGRICSSPAVKDTIVYFNNYGARFYAVNNKNGQEIWSFNTDGENPRTGMGLNWSTPKNMVMTDLFDFYLSSPVIADTMIYFGSGANVYAINLKNNEMVWKFTAPNIVHSSPAVYDGIIYFGCWDSKLYALDAATGAIIWSYQTGLDPANHGMEGIQSSPTIIDTVVVFGSRDANVYALHAKTGRKIWSTSFGDTWMPSSFAYYNKTLFTGSSEGGGLKALNILNGNIKFATSKNFYITFSTPAIADRTAFVGCMNGSLFAVDINSGTIKCRFDTDGRISDPLNAILDDGSLNPAVFNPVSGTPFEQAVDWVRRLLTAGSILSTPVIDKNVVYFGSADSSFYAVYDAGNCKPNFHLMHPKIELGNTSDSIVDTAIYVSNVSDCPDSAKIYVSTLAALVKAIEIQPANINVAPHDSTLVHIRLNMNNLKTNYNYTAKIVTQSKTNEYQHFDTEISFRINTVTGVSEIDKDHYNLVYPNPFSESVHIKYALEQDCFVAIKIYSSSGQLVRILTSQKQTTGEHQVTWDGNNDKGVRLNAGLYLCSIAKGDSILNEKLLFINPFAHK